jgi:hypothetical protein
MPAPTAFTVGVNDVEFSRYEAGRDLIVVSLQATGGAPYVAEPVIIDLRKARRSRDAVVATADVSLNAGADPASLSVSFVLPEILDQDEISLIRHGKYFVQATYEAVAASTTIGDVSPDGQVLVTALEPGTVGNNFSIVIVTPVGDTALTTTRVGDQITISLATASGVPVAASNTATLIRDLINSTYGDELVATNLGVGTSPISVAETALFSGGANEVIGVSEDFDIRVLTTARLKDEFLFGVPLEATDTKSFKFPPTNITGITVTELSPNMSNGFANLVYNYAVNNASNASVNIGTGVNGTVTVEATGVSVAGAAGNSLSVEAVIPVAADAPLTVNFFGSTLTISLGKTGGLVNPSLNTATRVADAISALTEFTGTASGDGSSSISAFTVVPLSGGVDEPIRTLSWNNGPVVSITAPGTYVLQEGAANLGPAGKLCSTSRGNNFICVRVTSLAALPTSSAVDALLVQNQKLDDSVLGKYIDETIDLIENSLLNVYIEPTNVVTERFPGEVVQFAAGVNSPIPIFTDADYDFIVSPLTYFVPQGSGAWVKIHTPFKQVLRVDSLFGAIANTRVIDIDLEWIEISQNGGLIQLVPFNQEIAFNFLGLIWVNAIRGATEIPNFWRYNMMVGLRDAPGEIREWIGRLASIRALTFLAQAFNPGVGSQSLSRDGVSQSVSYINSQQFGIYTGTISAHQKWLEDNEAKIKARYRGPIWAVV